MDTALEQANILLSLPRGYYRDMRYSPVYLFTTENINGMLKNVDITNKRVLTVSASGDHIFNMLLKGTKEIDSFDINYLTKYYYYFKESAIKVLSYDEFINFFFPKRFRSKEFNDKMFLKIVKNITEPEILNFWYKLYSEYGSVNLYHSNLFCKEVSKKSTYMECNLYLNNESNYKKLQSILKDYKYKFIWIDIFKDISNIQDNLYDFIYLSNIFDRLHVRIEEEYANIIKNISNNLENNLKQDGILGLSYLYCYLDNYWPSFNMITLSNYDIRYKYFKDTNIYDFNGFNSIKSSIPKNKDAIMIKRKER